jgi:hypothetical protein
VSWVYAEFVLVTLAAMLSPTTLTFSILVLVLSDRPFRAGCWFYLGALVATICIGLVAAFVLGDAAASSQPSSPRTWVAIVDVVAAVLLLAWVSRVLRRPRDPERAASMMAKMKKITASPAIAIAGAGATLANPGGFIPLALKEISELDPGRVEYIADWLFFSLISLLPLAAALVLLKVVPEWTRRALEATRGWLELHSRTIAAIIVVALALTLARNGIAGLTS